MPYFCLPYFIFILFKQLFQVFYFGCILKFCVFVYRVIVPDDKDNIDCPEDNSIEKILGTRDSNSVSAFEVYSKKNYSNNNKSNNKQQKSTVNTNPIRLMQEAAKKFGLSVLSTELEKLRYVV